MFRKYLFTIIYGIMLTAFTVYVAMDTFVITRVYSSVPAAEAAEVTAVAEAEAAEATAEAPEDAATAPEDAAAAEAAKATAAAKAPKDAAAAEAPDASAAENNSSAQDSASQATPSAQDSASQTTPSAQDSASQTAVSTDTTYADENIQVTVTEYREYDSTIYVADVVLSSPEYLKTALAQDAYGKNVTEKTSAMALANDAVLAINGDYYGAQEKGYVLRNGVLYRDTAEKGQEDLVIYEDGSFEIIVEDQVSAQELLDKSAVQILSFGPALVTDSAISVTSSEEVGKARSSNPRTAIGVIDDLHYVFVVSDGRTDESEGLSLYQLAEFMTGLGARTAYNLDGGGSSTMVFNGSVINTPTGTGRKSKERSVSDIVYIG